MISNFIHPEFRRAYTIASVVVSKFWCTLLHNLPSICIFLKFFKTLFISAIRHLFYTLNLNLLKTLNLHNYYFKSFLWHPSFASFLPSSPCHHFHHLTHLIKCCFRIDLSPDMTRYVITCKLFAFCGLAMWIFARCKHDFHSGVIWMYNGLYVLKGSSSTSNVF